MTVARKKRKRPLPAGWMGKGGRLWLAEHASQAQDVIEVGAWLGRSTRVLTKATPGRVWVVDTWEGTPNDPAQHEKLYAAFLADHDPYAEFCQNLRREIEKGKVIPIRGKSIEAAELIRTRSQIGMHTVPQSFDFVFIDADHSYAGIAADLTAFAPLVRSGGILAGHDYHWPGVAQAVNERFPQRELGPSSIWWVRR